MAEDNGGHCLLVLYGRVGSFITAYLSSYVFVPVASCVCGGVWPMICDEGRCHMVEGRFSSRTDDLPRRSGCPKITSSSRMEESTADSKSVVWEEEIQIGVSALSDPSQELQPEIPAASILGDRSVSDAIGSGFSRAKLAIHEVISSGTCTIFMSELERDG